MENTASTLDVFAVHELALEERNETADAFDVFKMSLCHMRWRLVRARYHQQRCRGRGSRGSRRVQRKGA
jgi:hypothetical protein